MRQGNFQGLVFEGFLYFSRICCFYQTFVFNSKFFQLVFQGKMNNGPCLLNFQQPSGTP